jgi:membrane fusion protein, copper/silver efflux system
MRRFLVILFILTAVAVGAGAGWYFFYNKKPQIAETPVVRERKVLFYRHAMNPSVTSSAPKKDEMGMDYIPVYEDEKPAQMEKKVLFYRAPMDPKITSPVPKKDSMGMDYIPVYEEEAKQGVSGVVSISPEKIQKIGVKSEEAKRRTIIRTIRTVGRVEHDEARVFNINTKVGGWIEKLYINRTDLTVNSGEKLLELYSPELVSTQEEYLLAIKVKERVKDSPSEDVKKNAESLVQAARQRLKYWDISDKQVKRLERKGQITRTMAILAPAHGIVTEKMVNEGQKIEAGEMLFKIIDHHQVWVYGEVYEYEMPFIKLGQTARIIPSYTPAEIYTATISHIYTHLGSIRHEGEIATEDARTAKIRFDLPNLRHKLKLGMYVNVELAVDVAKNAITVPASAMIDTGVRQVVIVDKGDGRFEPREVKVGAQGDGYYHIISGIKEGENVVTSANFLIDSESSFRAAVSGMKGH